jgi:hypothetical protein
MRAATIEQGHHMAALQRAFGEMYADKLRTSEDQNSQWTRGFR